MVANLTLEKADEWLERNDANTKFDDYAATLNSIKAMLKQLLLLKAPQTFVPGPPMLPSSPAVPTTVFVPSAQPAVATSPPVQMLPSSPDAPPPQPLLLTLEPAANPSQNTPSPSSAPPLPPFHPQPPIAASSATQPLQLAAVPPLLHPSSSVIPPSQYSPMPLLQPAVPPSPPQPQPFRCYSGSLFVSGLVFQSLVSALRFRDTALVHLRYHLHHAQQNDGRYCSYTSAACGVSRRRSCVPKNLPSPPIQVVEAASSATRTSLFWSSCG